MKTTRLDNTDNGTFMWTNIVAIFKINSKFYVKLIHLPEKFLNPLNLSQKELADRSYPFFEKKLHYHHNMGWVDDSQNLKAWLEILMELPGNYISKFTFRNRIRISYSFFAFF